MKTDLRKYVTNLKSQLNVDCCTASACLHAVEIMANKEGKSVNFSRLYLYYMTRKIQGKNTGGCRLSNAFKALMTYGVCKESLWPFRIHEASNPPPEIAIEDGVQNKLIEYKFIDISEINKYIIKEIPVIIGFNVGTFFSEIEGPLTEQYYKPINKTDNPRYTGHAATIIGFDDSICGGSWILANSLGQGWGDQGYGILPYICYPDIGEAYIIQRFAGLGADKKISDI
jgi:C1A family cysteine protease